MKNLDWLFEVAHPFREAVCQAAADWLGSTSLNFAGAWLMEQHKYEHHDSDYEDLRGQHLDGPCVVPDAAKSQISQFVAQETGETAESDAAKSEIRDFADNREKQVDRITDMVNAKWEELHGDSREKIDAELVDRFSHIGFCLTLSEVRKLLDRQAAITERDVLSHPDERDEQIAELESIAAMHIRRCTNLQAKLDYVLDERDQLQTDADAWRAKCGALLDAAHEMIRIGGDV